ncbi:hypothetical protein Enr13x_18450 [Stieleria neptunia]|uniref:DUF2764 domain-containing protein n=1 Tax=Stieleria neptunia TaxID=2527979 RepID=A0A518HMB5_9BACT|nr:DUF2764 family protein [Stieleria neptunia]QDV42002.1 hypothetical protein Enr13x_18450 [Stieleria neptunia]
MQSYYTLIASLPQLPRAFDDGPIPISAAALRHRLSMLGHHDRQIVQQVSDFFRWDRQPRDRSDVEIRETHRRLVVEIRHPLVARLVHHRFEMRMLVAALRCQRDGSPPPVFPELPLAVWIQRHWDEPCFRLNDRFHWLPRFCQSLDDHQPRRAQWHLFTELWNHWSRWNDHYNFSFESVVLYVARWEILHRWASQDVDRGRQRFNALVDDLLQTGGVNC